MEELQKRSLQRTVALGSEPAEKRPLKPSQSRPLSKPRLLAISLGLMVALGGLAISMVLAAPDVEDNFARFWPLAFAGFPIVGALVLWRKPGNRVGLIMLWIGISAGIPQAINAAAVAVADPEFSAILERIGNSLPVDWILVIALLVVFPSGSPSSRTMTWLLRVLFILTPFMIALAIVADFPLPASGRDNPLALPALRAASEVAIAGFVIVPASATAALISIVRRWRNASGTDRLQFRWFAFGIGLLVIGVGSANLPWFNSVLTVLAIIVGVNAVPVAIGIAVLRYRLYEIDRLVSRTVSYAAVIAFLAIIYVSTVYLAQTLVGAESQVTVAASTLAAAAAFNPLRRRVQAVVDHRFNRSRFNAESEAAAFADRLHMAHDLNTVIDDLGDVLSQTVRPASSTLWIRG
jgi:hypothetical protein